MSTTSPKRDAADLLAQEASEKELQDLFDRVKGDDIWVVVRALGKYRRKQSEG